jgi:hypothetical protein
MRPRRSMPPRLRIAEGRGTTLCRLPGAAWWEQLSSEIDASEKSSGELAEALVAQQAIAQTPAAIESLRDPMGEPTADGAGAENHGDAPLMAENGTGAGIGVPPAAVAGDNDPPAGAEPNIETALLPEPALSAASPAQLLVLVTDLPAPSPVVVTQAPEAAPGYARAMAVRPDGSGGSTWTQATVSSDNGLELALVMPGDGAQWWE